MMTNHRNVIENIRKILAESVFVDLEIHPETNVLLKIGAWKPREHEAFYKSGRFNRHAAIKELFTFVSSSDFIIGHNIHQHDWAYLIAQDNIFQTLEHKLIDTLILSPLAFPENPYHHLVKDYKIQRESINDPVEDCKQTEKLFNDQCHGFSKNIVLSGIYGKCLNETSKAYGKFFKRLLGSIPNSKEVNDYLMGNSFGVDKICRLALKPLLPTLTQDSLHKRAFAYALAWLSIAGTNSILPAWVRNEHQELVDILNKLRNQSCGHENCGYCKAHHHLETNLDTFFGYKAFRDFGEDDDSSNPLQKRIVTSVIRGQSTLAILPTGGGKSLCYQLPAMMMARNRGVLTLIISPLQSLMRDQVQQLNDRGYLFAAYLNSSLNMPERHKVLEGIRMGDIHLLYVAPEQLRNNSFIGSIKSREIGQWIIDEAHCLSKWGHDFRPDYLYIAKFIKEFSAKYKQAIPPVHAFTATARLDVVKEIKAHFKKTLGLDMDVLSGGHGRNNLTYQVLPCAMSEKREKTLELLDDYRELMGDGAAVIFCNRRKITEDMATFLSHNGWSSDYFHAGRTAKEKQDIQQSFMQGDIKVMAATNAFGMGVDKANIRLVIHAQMPDSIENYLQEAGRSGRDGMPAHCVLLLNDDDVDKQFEMRRNQQIDFRDFVSLFEAIRRKAQASNESDGNAWIIQVSSGEIMRQAAGEDDLELGFDGKDYQADTKVRTAIAWLEEKEFLERKENKTGVIEGSFKITSKDAILQKLKEQHMPDRLIQACLRVAMAVMQHHDGESINADQLAEETGLKPKNVFRIIKSLQDAGIMDHDMSLIAWLSNRGENDSRKLFSRLETLEKQLFDFIEEETSGDIEQDFHLNRREACHRLREVSDDVLPNDISMLLTLWHRVDHLLRITLHGDYLYIHWRNEFSDMKEHIQERQALTDVALSWLYNKLPTNEKKNNLRVPFKLGEMEDELRGNLLTSFLNLEKDSSERTLLALEKSHVLGLDSGAAIFHPAMTLHIPKNKNKPTMNTYIPLEQHYQAQIRQVHLMAFWASRMATKDKHAAEQLLNDYFQDTEEKLLKKYFPNDRNDLDTSAMPERVQGIIGEKALSLIQRQIVQQSSSKNMLVLAGPGSGKTRLLVHRVAWLVCVQRVKPKNILILAYNRSTVTELRRRLSESQLLGTQAYGLEIHTYHSLSMRLLGEFPPENRDDFQAWSAALIGKAVALLSNDDDDEYADRRKVMGSFQHILVDEYQDINEVEYELLSAIAGRALEAEEDKLTMFAVGDDDQNIYAWQGSDNKYIQQFQTDYQASIEYMTINYRSSPAIVKISNALIAKHPNRLKENHPIEAFSKEIKGKVRLFTGDILSLQTKAIEICKYLVDNETLNPLRIAILCRDHAAYQAIASGLRCEKLPICIIKDKSSQGSLPWRKLREVAAMLQIFDGDAALSAADIRQSWQQLSQQIQHHQSTQVLWQWLDAYHDKHSQNRTNEIIRSCHEWRVEIYELGHDVSKKMGQGIHIGTMHSAKGLEFDTVIVFAGKQKDSHEELRLRYVAMTRAERNLILMQENHDYDWFKSLPVEAVGLPIEAHEQSDKYDVYVCNMKDIDLDFGGHPNKALHSHHVDVENILMIDDKSGILSCQENQLGRLSKGMKIQLEDKKKQGWSIREVKVHAVLRRHKIDSTEGNFRNKCRQEQWDVFIPEIHFQKNTYSI